MEQNDIIHWKIHSKQEKCYLHHQKMQICIFVVKWQLDIIEEENGRQSTLLWVQINWYNAQGTIHAYRQKGVG